MLVNAALLVLLVQSTRREIVIHVFWSVVEANAASATRTSRSLKGPGYLEIIIDFRAHIAYSSDKNSAKNMLGSVNMFPIIPHTHALLNLRSQ